MEEYARRNELLYELGFKNYRAYLRSKLWKEIRARKLNKDTRCYSCGSTNRLQVHHSCYSLEALLGTAMESLFVVCARCHHRCEFAGKRKLGPAEATIKLKQMRRLFRLRRQNGVRNHVRVITKQRWRAF